MSKSIYIQINIKDENDPRLANMIYHHCETHIFVASQIG